VVLQAPRVELAASRASMAARLRLDFIVIEAVPHVCDSEITQS
jgi:hypothetical protein